MIKVIYFDLGGVIFRDFFSGCLDDFVEKLKLSQEKIFDAYISTDPPEYSKNQLSDEIRWQNFVKALGFPNINFQECQKIFYDIYRPYNETVLYLKSLRLNKKLKLGVLSDQPFGVAEYLRQEYKDIFNYFVPNLILISAEIRMSKKDPDLKIYDEAIKRSFIDSAEILFIDNSMENINNAQKKGLKTFYFDIKSKHISDLIRSLKNML